MVYRTLSYPVTNAFLFLVVEYMYISVDFKFCIITFFISLFVVSVHTITCLSILRIANMVKLLVEICLFPTELRRCT